MQTMTIPRRFRGPPKPEGWSVVGPAGLEPDAIASMDIMWYMSII